LDDGNVIAVAFRDLTEEDQCRIREVMRLELEEVEAMKMHEKLACYQKARGGVMQKVDTIKASSSKVNSSSFTPEELVHLADVSVASKYGANLAQLTHALAEDVRGELESFRQDLDDNLPHQIQSVVKEVIGNVQGKQTPDTAGISTQQVMPPHGGVCNTTGGYHNTQPTNPNLQLSYYQATGYGPTLTTGGVPYGPWPETHPPAPPVNPFMLNTDRAARGEMSDGVRDQVTQTLGELRFAPRGWAKAYHKSYPEYFDTVPYPRGFRVPDFVKFIGDDSRMIYEHIGQYLVQINHVGINDVHQIRLFSLSLFGAAFSWFTSLAPNSVNTWAGLEEKFHENFYNGETKLKLSDLTSVR
jgi:hypothetical protein